MKHDAKRKSFFDAALFKIAILSTVTGCLFLLNDVHAQDKLLQPNDLTYIGSFKVPLGDLGGPAYRGLNYGGEAIAYNPDNNSLFITGHASDKLVAEISIPPLVNSKNLSDLNRAIVLQNLADIAEGNINKVQEDGTTDIGNGAKIGGLLKYGNKLIAGVYSYYDGQYLATRSHFTSGLKLATTGDFSGMLKVGNKPDPVPNAGMIGGYMAPIPPAWQQRLGGKVLSGISTLAILGRTSSGSAAFAIDPDAFSKEVIAPATALLYYPLTNQTIGTYQTSGTLYNKGTHHVGIFFPSGTRSILYTGRQGLGPACYGQGTNIEIEHGNKYNYDPPKNTCMGVPMTDTQNPCCYDPLNLGKGPHAYPYSEYVWAYDAEDLERVRLGGRIVDNPSPNLVDGLLPTSTETYKPWHIKPYAYWSMTYPFTSTRSITNGAAAYDDTNQILYLAQGAVEGDMPVIHAYKLNINLPIIKTIITK